MFPHLLLNHLQTVKVGCLSAIEGVKWPVKFTGASLHGGATTFMSWKTLQNESDTVTPFQGAFWDINMAAASHHQLGIVAMEDRSMPFKNGS